MRVTQNILFRESLRGFQSKFKDIRKAQEQSLTGFRINRASDDPRGINRHVRFTSTVRSIDSYVSTAKAATHRLSVAENHIGTIEEHLITSLEIATQMANEGTATTEGRSASAEHVRLLFDQTLTSANTSFDGIALFGGGRTNTAFDTSLPSATAMTKRVQDDPDPDDPDPDVNLGGLIPSESTTVEILTSINTPDIPTSIEIQYDAATDTYSVRENMTPIDDDNVTFTVDDIENERVLDLNGWAKVTIPNDVFTPTQDGKPRDKTRLYFELLPTYRGGSLNRTHLVGNSTQFQENLTGDKLFEGVGSPERQNVFGVLTALRGALLRDDTEEITARIDVTSQARTQTSQSRANTGLRIMHLETHQETLANEKLSIEESIVDNSETDLYEILPRLLQVQQALQATVESERMLLQTSLVDFLR